MGGWNSTLQAAFKTTHGVKTEIKLKKMAHEKKGFRGFETSTWNAQGKRATCLTTQFFTCLHSDWYVSTYTNRHLRSEQLFWAKKTARLAGRRRERGRDRPRQSRERRTRWGTTSKQHNEWLTSSSAIIMIARLRLKTWCKNDFSIAHASPHSSHIYVFIATFGLCRLVTSLGNVRATRKVIY